MFFFVLIEREKGEERKKDEFFSFFRFRSAFSLPRSLTLSFFLSLFLLLSRTLTPVVVHLVDDDAEAVPLGRGNRVVAAPSARARRRRRRRQRRRLLLLLFRFPSFSYSFAPSLFPFKGQEAQVGPVAQKVAVSEDGVGLGELGVDQVHGEGQVGLAGVLLRRSGERGEKERGKEVEVRERLSFRERVVKEFAASILELASLRFPKTHGPIEDVVTLRRGCRSSSARSVLCERGTRCHQESLTGATGGKRKKNEDKLWSSFSSKLLLARLCRTSEAESKRSPRFRLPPRSHAQQ